ncbi:MAG TPA: TldD/PmbA family protein [Armatimonadota bacterium]|nr:TldD/PmbA family protein [Armatimonadota bacterium]
MLGRDNVLEILRKAIEYCVADVTQAAFGIGESSLTRFANSVIHQNVSERNAGLAVKAVIGKRIGYATTNRLDERSVRAVVDRAVEFARHSRENPDFVSLPKPKPVSAVDTYDERTAACSPEERADAVAGMIAEACNVGASAAGSLSNGCHEFAVANSLGVAAYNLSSSASLTTVMSGDGGFGYADRVSQRVGDLDPIGAAVEAATRSVQSRNPESIEPGEYDVVLLPYAVSELVEALGYLGLGALAVQEGRSFMCGKFGQKITGENVTIWDDGLDLRGLPRPFDAEGVPKQRVDLIVNGVANAVVYDSYTANKEGRESTGHSTGGVGTYGPMPANLFMQSGESSIGEMIAGTKKGILVTRFHYTNVIHPVLTVITGMTRDGTFLIENGKITKSLKNLRFTDSILERLSNVELISKETKRQGWAVVPAIKARAFRFTGATEF